MTVQSGRIDEEIAALHAFVIFKTTVRNRTMRSRLMLLRSTVVIGIVTQLMIAGNGSDGGGGCCNASGCGASRGADHDDGGYGQGRRIVVVIVGTIKPLLLFREQFVRVLPRCVDGELENQTRQRSLDRLLSRLPDGSGLVDRIYQKHP